MSEVLLRDYDLAYMEWYNEHVQPDHDTLKHELMDIILDTVHIEESTVSKVVSFTTVKMVYRFAKEVLKSLLKFIRKSLNRFVYWLTGYDKDAHQTITTADGRKVRINFEKDITSIDKDLNDMTASMNRAMSAEKRFDINGMRREKEFMKTKISKKGIAKAVTVSTGLLCLHKIIKTLEKIDGAVNSMVANMGEEEIRKASKNTITEEDGKVISELDKEISSTYASFIERETGAVERIFKKLHITEFLVNWKGKEFEKAAVNPNESKQRYYDKLKKMEKRREEQNLNS